MDKVLKNVIKKAVVVTLVLIIYGLIIKEPSIYFGMASGCIISILNFYLLINDTKKYIAISNKVQRIAFAGYLKRYAISGILLFIMIKIGIDYFFGAVLGILLVKFIILFTQFYNIAKERLKMIFNKR
ncbi:ATP synthase subunit I [Haliovirga abyssi]|uniref:ATP synthase subunit I n=1 Tax=Haliovirga abyssi TaxID=2996794 RepID=A0AAU9DNR0_9FUSO|nr:ATP synthase subunit I [Haliovirga abyssi]BDU50008.1 hypothetical protein HLVA_05770 [Haliovirga abyssi]